MTPLKNRNGMKKNLLMINTGNGKGKTTAALGLAFRAVGHGFKVSIIQFIKGGWACGEIETAARLADLIDFNVMGRGFTWKSDDLKKDTALALSAWETAKERIASGKYRLVILDEMTYLFKYGMLDEDTVIAFLQQRPENVHVLITGRDAPEKLLAAADMVTEMHPVKHPFAEGVSAQKGIEY
jgi:cob(I)alamin adenosyltransferase